MNVLERDGALSSAGARQAPHNLSFVEFVVLTAAMMALTAISIDIMLPALPQIGTSLGVASENDRRSSSFSTWQASRLDSFSSARFPITSAASRR
jgi:hypothetical protein